MKADLLNRLKRIEASKPKNIPDLIIIFLDDHNQWIVREEYLVKTETGRIKKGSGRNKYIKVNDPSEYKPPEGFKGTLITKEWEIPE